VVSPNGCQDSICHQVYIAGDVTVYVPNAFTPDGDGVNDFFYPVCGDIDRDDFRVLVFDRWGSVIFETHDLAGKWDGTQNGVRCKEDIYVWKVKFREKSGVAREVIGHVSLLR
jgi:gliding motility-associated-like protein